MVTPIMTTTLPTVIAMGVTSRAIDTTLGKQSRGGKKRSKRDTIKVYRGPRGGRYIIRKNRKIYL